MFLKKINTLLFAAELTANLNFRKLFIIIISILSGMNLVPVPYT